MRILMLIPELEIGGAERVFVSLANSFSECFDVEIVTLNKCVSHYEVDTRIMLINLDKRRLRRGVRRKLIYPLVFMKRFMRLTGEVSRFQPDIIVSFLHTANVLALAESFCSGIPLVISERNDPTQYHALRKAVCALAYGRADRVVCQSSFAAAFHAKHGSNCVVIPNPINPKAIGHFSPHPNGKIVAVGRLVTQKNHMLLIKAFQRVQLVHPECLLEIYGNGPLKAKLDDMIMRLGLGDRASVKPAKENIISELASSTCFVLSSNHEGQPNVLLEAMATGIPVISTDFPSHTAAELIKDGVNGFLIPLNSEEQLAKRIITIIEDPSLRYLFALNNGRVCNAHSLSSIAQRWIDLFRELTAK